jgi:hypothetical protein
MYKFGFWNLLYRVLSKEGYQFMKDAGGYEANVANACAVTQLPATEYGDNTEFLTLRDGYEQLPITLAKFFQEMPGILPSGERLQMNQRLAQIELGEGRIPIHALFRADSDGEARNPGAAWHRGRHSAGALGGSRQKGDSGDAAALARVDREQLF